MEQDHVSTHSTLRVGRIDANPSWFTKAISFQLIRIRIHVKIWGVYD